MRALSFLAGLLLGVFGLLILQNVGALRELERRARAGDAATPSSHAARGGRPPAGEASAASEEIVARIVAALGDPRGKSLDPLAVGLEEAIFEGDWSAVQAVATLIRQRGAEWVAPPVAPAPVPVEEKTFFDQALEFSRRFRDLRMRGRKNAATALAGRTDPRTVAQLIDLIQTSRDEDERLDAAVLAARSGDEAGLRALVAGLRSTSPRVRNAVALALGWEGYREGALEAAAILRSEGDRDFHETALASLAAFDATRRGEPHHPATAAFLEAMANATSPALRRQAVASLRNMDLENGRVLADALYERLATDEAEVVRAQAMETLGEFALDFAPPPGSVARVARALRDEASVAVRASMLKYLERYGESEALSAIDEFAATPGAQQNLAEIAAARTAIADRISGR